MEPVELEVKHAVRDPMGDVQRYNDIFWVSFNRLNGKNQQTLLEEFLTWGEAQRLNFLNSVISNIQERILYMYSRGDPTPDLVLRLQDDLPFIQTETQAYRSRWGALSPEQVNPQEGSIRSMYREGFSYVALALLLLPQREDLQTLSTLLNTVPANRLYALELLLKAFVPEWKLAKKYNRKDPVKYALPWSDPILRALSLPAAERAPALASYMKGWGRTMKPWGWKPSRDYSPEAAKRRGELESVFEHFAYEVALAVCAYDIDDSSFQDHPYYPRDLVAHYRTHLRHSRDDWRAVGIGAGVPIELPPPPKKAELSKSKRKGLARWVELASDGDIDATDAVIDQVGKLRKVKELSELSCVLAENDIGIHADIKDDETLESQLTQLCAARGLGEFEAPSDPPAGPARCEQLLLAGAAWLKERGYRLLDLDGDDDAWHAVLVKTQYHDEFLALSLQLAVTAREPSEIYG